MFAGCAEFPSFGERLPNSTDISAYPRIEPIEGLIIRALGPGAISGSAPQPIDALTDSLDARIAALKQRAAILRGAGIDDETRALLASQ